MEDYGLALKKLRKHFSLTQREVAERVGISNHAISKWENGINQPDLSSLRTICSGYGITVEDFFRIAAGEEVEDVLKGTPAQDEELATTQSPAPQTEEKPNLGRAGTGQTQNFLQRNSGVLALVCSVLAIILASIAFFAFAGKGDSPAESSATESIVQEEKENYVVQFDKGFEGESIGMEPFIQAKGEPWTLPEPVFRWEGYNFVGWEYNGWLYKTGTLFAHNGAAKYCTFTAKWEPIHYVLEIHSEIHDETFREIVSYGEEVRIGEIILSHFNYPYDYVFIGFIVHGMQFSPNDILSNLASSDGSVVAVEALWSYW